MVSERGGRASERGEARVAERARREMKERRGARRGEERRPGGCALRKTTEGGLRVEEEGQGRSRCALRKKATAKRGCSLRKKG